MTPDETRPTARLDADAVATAALALAARGELISTTAVQRELGRGSMTTVAKHLKHWSATAMPLLAGQVTAPNWTARELEGMSLLRRVFREEAAQALAEDRAEAKAEVESARQAAEAGREQVRMADAGRERAEERARGLEAGLAGLQEQLAAGARDRENQAAQIERLQAANSEAAAQYERTVVDLRAQIEGAVDRYKGMERHMLLEIDRARTEREQAVAKATDELRLANARAQQRTQEAERARGEREAAAAGKADAERRVAEAERRQAEAERRQADAERRHAEAQERERLASKRADTMMERVSALAEQLAVAAERTQSAFTPAATKATATPTQKAKTTKAKRAAKPRVTPVAERGEGRAG